MSTPKGFPTAPWRLSSSFVTLLLLTSFMSSIALGGATDSSSSVISYSLKPHHVLREERRRERLLVEDRDNTESEASSGSVRRRQVAQQVGALYQGYGTHYVDLWCGTPPQRQTVIVDTGSGVTAFPCAGCTDCGVPKYHIDNLFDADASSTYALQQCDSENKCTTHRGSCHSNSKNCFISMSYAEGSRWDAIEARDHCYVGGPHNSALMVDQGSEDIDPKHASHFAFGLVFGCQSRVTGLFKTQLADGIMGMDSRTESFWSQMFRAGQMGAQKQFALCFSRQPTAARAGTESGALTLGGVDTRLHLTDMVYTTHASGGRSGFYSVKVRAIYLRDGSAGESAKSSFSDPVAGTVKLDVPEETLNTGGIIVDSGTTDTYWNKQLAPAFKSAYQTMAGKSYSHSGVKLTKEQLQALPTILVQLQADENANSHVSQDADQVTGLVGSLDPNHPRDVLLAIPPSHYMEYDADNNKYTARFYVTESGGSVLGANAIMGHDVLFDVDNDRIGWAESDCDYTHLLTENGYTSVLDGEFTGTSVGGNINVGVSDSDSGAEGDGSSSAASNTEKDKGGGDGQGNQQQGDTYHTTGATTGSENDSKSVTEVVDLLVDACDSNECRLSVAAGFLVLICLGCCLGRCCCNKSEPEHGAYQKVAGSEVEMMDDGQYSSYKDLPSENGKGEFDGDFS